MSCFDNSVKMPLGSMRKAVRWKNTWHCIETEKELQKGGREILTGGRNQWAHTENRKHLPKVHGKCRWKKCTWISKCFTPRSTVNSVFPQTFRGSFTKRELFLKVRGKVRKRERRGLERHYVHSSQVSWINPMGNTILQGQQFTPDRTPPPATPGAAQPALRSSCPK